MNVKNAGFNEKIETDILTLDQCPELTQICQKLNCYKVRNNSIITRCIYCGDSVKHTKDHGHFYMFRDFPFCTCFRCGTQLLLVNWLDDLENKFPEYTHLIDNIRDFVKTNFNLYTISKRKTQLNVEEIDFIFNSITFEPKFEDYPEWFIKRYFYYISSNEHPIYYGIYPYMDTGIIVFSYNMHVVAIKENIDKKFSIKYLSPCNDIFLFHNPKATCYDSNIIYITESILDAIKISNITNIPCIATNGQLHLSSIMNYINFFYKPEKFIIIYDNDVDQKIISLQRRRMNFALYKRNIKINYLKMDKFKDINDQFLFNKPKTILKEVW